MGEEMEETKGTAGGGGEERRAEIHFTFPWNDPSSFFFFFFYSPLQIQGSFEINPRPCPPSLTRQKSSSSVRKLRYPRWLGIYIRTSVWEGMGMGTEEIAGHPSSIERRSTLCPFPFPHPQSVTRQTQDDADRVFIPGFRRGGLVTTFNP